MKELIFGLESMLTKPNRSQFWFRLNRCRNSWNNCHRLFKVDCLRWSQDFWSKLKSQKAEYIINFSFCLTMYCFIHERSTKRHGPCWVTVDVSVSSHRGLLSPMHRKGSCWEVMGQCLGQVWFSGDFMKIQQPIGLRKERRVKMRWWECAASTLECMHE